MSTHHPIPTKHLLELQDENNTLKSEITELREQLRETRKELCNVKEQLTLSEQVTIATQRRELQQEGVYEKLLDEKIYENLRPELTDEHNYPKQPPAGVEVLQQQYKTIATRLEAQVVAAYLYQTKAITFKDLQKIQSLRDIPVQAAETLLEIILEQPVAIYQCFLDVLKDKQNHIYEQLLKDSYEGYDEQQSHMSVIREHYVFLRDSLDVKSSGLVGELYSKQALSAEERDDIRALKTLVRANEMLLSVLSRKSPKQFQQFLDALDNCGQQHVRKVLSDQRVTVPPERPPKPKMQPSKPMISRPTPASKRQRPRTDESITQEYQSSSPRVSHTIPSNEYVCGVTLLDRELYVLRRRNRNQIDIYSTSTTDFALLHRRNIRRLSSNFIDIVSCLKKKCIYIADVGSTCIHRVQSDRSETKWLVMDQPRGVSVTPSSNLLVMFSNDGRHNVAELSGDSGHCIREIRLEIEPRHALLLNSGQLVVCHANKVSQVADNGTVVRSTDKDVNLNSPYRMTADNNNFVFVADQISKQVLLFDPSLTYVCTVMECTQYKHRPCRLCYDDVSRRLYVGNNEGDVIVVQL